MAITGQLPVTLMMEMTTLFAKLYNWNLRLLFFLLFRSTFWLVRIACHLRMASKEGPRRKNRKQEQVEGPMSMTFQEPSARRIPQRKSCAWLRGKDDKWPLDLTRERHVMSTG